MKAFDPVLISATVGCIICALQILTSAHRHGDDDHEGTVTIWKKALAVLVFMIIFLCAIAIHFQWESDILGITAKRDSNSRNPSGTEFTQGTTSSDKETVSIVGYETTAHYTTVDTNEPIYNAVEIVVDSFEYTTKGYSREFPTEIPGEYALINIRKFGIYGTFHFSTELYELYEDDLRKSFWVSALYSVSEKGQLTLVDCPSDITSFLNLTYTTWATELPDSLSPGDYCYRIKLTINSEDIICSITFSYDGNKIILKQ